MPFRRQTGNKRLAQAALIAGLTIGTTTAVVYADPGIDPAPEPNASTPADTTRQSDTQTGSSKVGTAVSDTTITTKVKYDFATDNRLNGASIKVKTNNGVVQLAGNVQSEAQKDAAEQLVQQVKGVKGVDSSQIIVASAR